MYKISVPVMQSTISEKTLGEYLKFFQEAKVNRVFIAFGPINASLTDQAFENIKRAVSFFETKGIEPAVWVGSTLGHGGNLLFENDNKEGIFGIEDCIVTMQGTTVQNTYCPLSPSFLQSITKCVQDVARTGVKTILLDDDFRMSQRGEGFCCCCDKHLALMSEKCGELVTREILREKAFVGAGNKYRDAWLESQAEGLRNMAIKIRSAVDEVSTDINIGLCSAWAPWDLDGVDPIELAKILAGKNKPLIRTLGAPYWATGDASLPSTIETGRMFASFCENKGIELMCEGDAWPRPRYNVPSSYLEVYDATQRAIGAHDGILKYMFDYVSTPNYESGYVERHIKNLPLMEDISKTFATGKTEGVRVCVYPHKVKNSVYPKDFFDFTWPESQMPYVSGNMLLSASIPAVYNKEGMCSLITGENARYVTPDLYQKGAILDGWSAKLLHEQGVDVGIESVQSFDKTIIGQEIFLADNEKCLIKNGNCRLLDATYKKGVMVESVCLVNNRGYSVSYSTEGTSKVVSYRYENALGQKFFVLNISVEEQAHNLVFLNSYARQKQLIEAVEWIAGKKLPAKCVKNPQLYMVCKRKDNSLAVGLFNCFADSILKPVIKLDKNYSKVEFLGTKGSLKGDTIVLSEEIPAFGFVAFEVFE